MIKTKMIILLILIIPFLAQNQIINVKAQDETETSLTCEVSPSIRIGQRIMLDCILTPTNPRAIVTAMYDRPDGTQVQRNMTTSTGVHYYDYGYLPDMVGNWTVQTNWPGDEDLEGATSAPISFEVLKATTFLILQLPTRSTPGNPMNLTAILRAEDGKPIANAIITFSVHEEEIGFEETDEQGRATISYIPGGEAVNVGAVFEGDERYSGSTAKETIEAPMKPLNYTTIASVILVLLIASVLVAFYIFRGGRAKE